MINVRSPSGAKATHRANGEAMLSDSIILRKIARQAKQTAGYKQLVRELGLPGDTRHELTEHLRKLVSSGQLIQVGSDRYQIPQAASGKNLISGKLSQHRDGFGFVIPDLTSASANLKARIFGDIFIPPHGIGSAMHGDQVLAEVTNIRADGKAEGRILRPVRRAHPTVVGIFHYGSRHNYVTPLDQKIAHAIVIPHGLEYPENPSPVVTRTSPAKTVVRRASSAKTQDVQGRRSQTLDADSRDSSRGTHDARPTTPSKHRVLGEEASRGTDWNHLENVVVDVEITDWPSATQNPRGRVTEIIGE